MKKGFPTSIIYSRAVFSAIQQPSTGSHIEITLQWNSDILKLQGGRKIGFNNIRGKITVFTERREMTFGSSYQEV